MQYLRIISLCTMSAIAIIIGYRLERVYIYIYMYILIYRLGWSYV